MTNAKTKCASSTWLHLNELPHSTGMCASSTMMPSIRPHIDRCTSASRNGPQCSVSGVAAHQRQRTFETAALVKFALVASGTSVIMPNMTKAAFFYQAIKDALYTRRMSVRCRSWVKMPLCLLLLSPESSTAVAVLPASLKRAFAFATCSVMCTLSGTITRMTEPAVPGRLPRRPAKVTKKLLPPAATHNTSLWGHMRHYEEILGASRIAMRCRDAHMHLTASKHLQWA